MTYLNAPIGWFNSLSGLQLLLLGLSVALAGGVWSAFRPGKDDAAEPELPEGEGRLYEKVKGSPAPAEISPAQGEVNRFTTFPAGLVPSEPGLKLFGLGDIPSARNLVKDISAMPGALYFHYDYTVVRPRSSENFRFTVGFYKRPGLDLPEFELRPEGLADRVLALFGRKDINPGWNPEFSKRFYLSGPDKEAVAALFTPYVAGALSQIGGRWQAQGARDCVIFFRRGFLSGPAYGRFMRDAAAVFQALTNAKG